MFLKAEEFLFLEHLYIKCLYSLYDNAEIDSDDVATFSRLLEQLQKRHEASNARTRKYIAERRKVDKNYARTKSR